MIRIDHSHLCMLSHWLFSATMPSHDLWQHKLCTNWIPSECDVLQMGIIIIVLYLQPGELTSVICIHVAGIQRGTNVVLSTNNISCCKDELAYMQRPGGVARGVSQSGEDMPKITTAH